MMGLSDTPGPRRVTVTEQDVERLVDEFTSAAYGAGHSLPITRARDFLASLPDVPAPNGDTESVKYEAAWDAGFTAGRADAPAVSAAIELLREVAQNDYMIDGQCLRYGARMNALADELENQYIRPPHNSTHTENR
jgi:hypothetical protein